MHKIYSRAVPLPMLAHRDDRLSASPREVQVFSYCKKQKNKAGNSKELSALLV